MPALTTLDLILLVYFLVVSVAIVIAVAYLDKYKKKSSQLASNNDILAKRQALLQNQLALIQKNYESGHLFSDLETIFSQIDIGLMLLNSQKFILNINPAAEKFLGVSKTEILTQPFQEIMHLIDSNGKPDYRPLESTITENTSSGNQWLFCLVNNIIIPIYGTFTPLTGRDGTLQILFHFRNATEDFSQYRKLRENAELLSGNLEEKNREISVIKLNMDLTGKLIKYLDLAIIILDTNGNIIEMNPFSEKFLGILKNEAINKSYREILAFKDKYDKIDYSPIETVLNGGREVILPKWTFINTKDGKKTISGAVIPLSTENGQKYTVIYFEDISARYAEEAEEKAFFSSAAHDLRAPLTTIRGVAELLETSFDKIPPEQVKDLISGAKDSSIHLINLVNDLLNVSRIDQGRTEITKTAFDISQVTREVIENLQLSAKEKKLFLNFTLTDTSIPKVNGDRSKTIDVLTNLISNAIKYTHTGGITVTQSLHEGQVITRIEDTGIGISPENQKLLFRKYQQVGLSRNQPLSKSTGLGLYIAKKFALLMGGDVMLEKSEPEKGSVFSFSLPVGQSV
jgi:PAS domain S-box-containing protein